MIIKLFGAFLLWLFALPFLLVFLLACLLYDLIKRSIK